MNKLTVKMMTLGMVATHCYLAMNNETKELIIVDPADHAQRISDEIAKIGAIPVAILLTHGHFDHIGAADALREKYSIPVYASEPECELLGSPAMNLTAQFGAGYTVSVDKKLTDGQELTLAHLRIRVILTPGHTVGSCCYYLPDESLLFSGDTLFNESVGRSDFPTGSTGALVRSIREKLMILPDDTDVLPGHNDTTTIAWEKQNNPFA